MFVIFFFLLLFQLSDNLTINFDPNQLRLTQKPNNLVLFFSELVKTKQYAILAEILRTESSDFTPIYCNLWRMAENSEMIARIWEAFNRKEIKQSDFIELLVPECISKSAIILINLSEPLIEIIPNSLLQAKDASVHLLLENGSVLETILKKEVLFNRPHDPRIKWFNWISSPEFDFATPFSSPFYSKYGWQLVDQESFSKLQEVKTKCLLDWINDYGPELSSKEILMRSLTLASWDNRKGIQDFSSYLIRDLGRNNEIDLSIEILNISTEDQWTIELLLEVIEIISNELSEDIVIIGDWFIGILNLWRTVLESLTSNNDFLKKIVNFVFDLNPSFQGILKMTSLFDPEIKQLIEVKSIEKYKNGPYLKYFYREYPKHFQYSFKMIPLKLRWSSFLRRKRIFASSQGPFLLQHKFDLSLLLGQEKDFLLQIAGKFRNGIDDFSAVSLNPVALKFRGKSVPFKSLVEMLLKSITEAKQWLTRKTEGTVIIKPHCPEYFWELIGYFLIQAKILKIPIPFKLEKKFFLEMYQENHSISYISKLAKSFEKCPLSQSSVLNWNLRKKFTVISVTSYDIEGDNDNAISAVNCKQLAILLIKNGMQAMFKGINYIVGAFRFEGKELYSIVFD